MRMRWFLIGCLLGVGLTALIHPVEAGKLAGEDSSYAREQGLDQQLAYVASGNGVGALEYQGFAGPGAATSAARWQIRKFTYDSSNRISTIRWASGDDAFNQIWDNRASLTYP